MIRFVFTVVLCCMPFTVLAETAVATFAGGCFWCMEPPYDKLDGVISTTSGYTGGHVKNPGYEQVTGGRTGHYEAMQVKYDPDKVSYGKLLEVYWHNIDPFDSGGQFCDRGPQYRAAVFTHNDRQEKLARESKQALQEKLEEGQIVTEILPVQEFYPAEEYHQDYYQKNSLRYKFYRYSCGRDDRLEDVRKRLWPEESES